MTLRDFFNAKVSGSIKLICPDIETLSHTYIKEIFNSEIPLDFVPFLDYKITDIDLICEEQWSIPKNYEVYRIKLRLERDKY